MFYAKEMSKALRFGDVLRGYFRTTPRIEKPALQEPLKRYNIDVCSPVFCVVMDPCCEIRDKAISLTPLVKISGSLFNNPFLAEDLTRINRKMKPHQSMPPHAWKELPEEKKREREAVGLAYAFFRWFIYEGHDLLPKYTVHRTTGNIETNYYIINFRETFKLCCDKINSPEDSPLESKVLELSLETRQELRLKLISYYKRVPKEDVALED